MFHISVSEAGDGKGHDVFSFYLREETQFISWNKAINNAIKGKQHSPVFLAHNSSVNNSEGKNIIIKLEDFPRRSGSLKKKAVGKKLPGFK